MFTRKVRETTVRHHALQKRKETKKSKSKRRSSIVIASSCCILIGLLVYSTSMIRMLRILSVGNDWVTSLEQMSPPSTRKIRPASTDQVVSTLLSLASISTPELRRVFEGHDVKGDEKPNEYSNGLNKDPFHLTALERGDCSAVLSQGAGEGKNSRTGIIILDWLPPRPSPEVAFLFRSRKETKTDGHGDGSATNRQMQHGSNGKRNVLIWYEHLSKAGGTSFCSLAKENMDKSEVPRYHCMPSLDGKPDGRVGRWTNEELTKHVEKRGHAIVANEWEPFPLERLQLHPTTLNDADTSSLLSETLSLVLVTFIRHPLNRLVSAYRFWGILHNPRKKKPTFKEWLQRMKRRAHDDFQSPEGLGKKSPDSGNNFNAMVGRANFATWKFSGGTLPAPEPSIAAAAYFREREKWRDPFETAVRILSQFDLVIPTELLSQHPQPLRDILGWTKLNEAHKVPSGKIQNSTAEKELTSDEYNTLWDANKLDMILYYWVRAVYLIRVHCSEHILDG